MDLFEKFRIPGPLGRWRDVADGYFMFPRLEGPLGNRMKFQGKEVICWSINNYLGLANHPEVREADTKGAADWGLAYPMGARMMSGNSTLHEQLEHELADFVKKETAMLVNFGYQGVISAIDSLVNRHDVIVYDSESHACIVDGVRLHHGKRFAFEHNNVASLDKNLARATKLVEQTGGGILVITEGVFGMRGDQGKLREICALKEKYEFRLMVDDAHGFGMLGPTGAGACEEQGIMDDVDVYFSTFAKSMASIGAFFAGEKFMIQHLRFTMRSQIFAKSVPMPLVVGAIKRLELLRNKPELRKALWDNVNYLQSELKNAGFEIGETNSCVTPVYIQGDETEAMVMVRDLRENFGVFCSIVVYPVIPKGMIILRLIPTAVHTKEDIDITIAAFKEIKKKLNSQAYTEAAKVLLAGAIG
ncbi:MAG: aminotransferase class I/II-fold pyridoxal phosphate-dependent enzyme [Saprospiraceae bacterium]|nr:aminotransferase class I/II-fold pyridoxal phosphate-dependent enzyme [Saprospiraceae bacterium]MCF8251057.1 aminotransferase class I/II-fold pyridoxal phosphate-dependent enzyme [Saprospiraceae bacterium]MCF8280342.1 aminotransferase class I/II-fold pyridoxal phosphate-dependent enzyme [Bacteroidales bacterium]MCF8312887.1 aminotransferase class I/II-fold pyridoxal phosphate-dependent enzyme [Saprospiraceae bacterium]MCF8441316.1 aminotransferase class I/II-fold pyridoxal phosphate-dependen